MGKSNRLRLKIVTKGNGKEVLWSTYNLWFTNSENFSGLPSSNGIVFRREQGGGEP
jgi:hypothetical protein